MKLIWVKKAKYVKDFIVDVTFSDGATFTIDLKDSLTGPIFEPLKDQKYFKTFAVGETDTLSWDNGADFAPEFLYELGKKQAKLKK